MRRAIASLGSAALMVLGIGAGLTSCAEQGSIPAITGTGAVPTYSQSATEKARQSNPLAYLGVLHNQAMDQINRDLRKAARKKGAPLTQEETYTVLQETLDEFFSRRGMGPLQIREAQSWREFLAARPGASARELFEGRSTLLTDEIALSARAYDYLYWIADLAAQAETLQDYGWLQNQLWSVENAAAAELSGNDLDAVYAVSAVTLSSAEYWPVHADEWVSLCGETVDWCGTTGGGGGTELLPVVIMRVNGWKVLGADVFGAMGGFIRGAWVGAGVGAAVASGIAIIMQL